MNRRHFIRIGMAAGLTTATLGRPAFARPGQLEIFKSPTCGCCTAWMDHMSRAGFLTRALDVNQETLVQAKSRAGITPELSSCHTGFVDGYVIEGHVPASDVQRLLQERPAALGLAVPGMPIGSPGMEMGDRHDAYDTLLVLRDGATKVFSSHA